MKQLAKCLTKHLLVVLFLSSIVYKVHGQQESPLTLEASYVFDAVNSPNATLTSGNAYMGLIDLIASFSTDDAGWWQGGELYFQMENTHGATPSANMVGDLQVFSSLDNGNYTYLYQLWYKQAFNRFSLTIGKHDLNSEFLASDNAAEYINSSFGIMPSVSMNVMVSIFPKSCFGAVAAFDVSEQTNIKTAIYEGDPLSLDEEEYNIRFALHTNSGYFFISELSQSINLFNGLEGTYRMGAYYHSSSFADVLDETIMHKGNYGAYLIADQLLYAGEQTSASSLGSFLQVGYAPDDRNAFPFFWATGLNYYAPFSKRQDDVAGIAIASMTINNKLVGIDKAFQYNNEHVIECFYRRQINEKVALQPELQYIIHPGAIGGSNNTLLGLIRTSITF
ncbi:carbohydrate porin [Carboxylicivirga marina]|uniref:Carbohydrate porin n=1 Tax=Carboxylicivirga marina TaxID=2800988 RepID=A0ABS1HGZ3_9BACT|nr:carbohydrate porin [Carboxylicivirga marina]MBK3516890.1 carbohydrate porin [Carboxylicivirga marina]